MSNLKKIYFGVFNFFVLILSLLTIFERIPYYKVGAKDTIHLYLVNIIFLNILSYAFYQYYLNKGINIFKFKYVPLFLISNAFSMIELDSLNDIVLTTIPFEKWNEQIKLGKVAFYNFNPIIAHKVFEKSLHYSLNFPKSSYTIQTILYSQAVQILHLQKNRDIKKSYALLKELEAKIFQLNDIEQMIVYASLATLSNSVKDYKKGIDYASSCLKLAPSISNHPYVEYLIKECELQTVIYNTSINQYLGILENLDSLLIYYEKLFSKDMISSSNHLFQLAKISFEAQDFDKALTIYHLILDLIRPTCLTTSKVKVYYALSKLYEQKGIDIKSQIYAEYGKVQQESYKNKKCLKTIDKV